MKFSFLQIGNFLEISKLKTFEIFKILHLKNFPN